MSASLTVVIPCRDRPHKLAETVGALLLQTLDPEEYEVLVVDDGSTPPLLLDSAPSKRCRILRLDGGGRSAARNAGAAAAAGGLLVFVDDDISVRPDFLEEHRGAHVRWPGALIAGAIRLPADSLHTPFGRFRQRLEKYGVPVAAGLFENPGICAAGNMSIARSRFLELGGFDGGLASAEDQDLALRHVGRGGSFAFLPEAAVVHRDDALSIRSYCRRTGWGAEQLIPFCRRYPDLPENCERARVNGPAAWAHEPLSLSLKKLSKSVLAGRAGREGLFALARLFELIGAERLTERAYRWLLGVHVQSGYRRGLQRLADSEAGR